MSELDMLVAAILIRPEVAPKRALEVKFKMGVGVGEWVIPLGCESNPGVRVADSNRWALRFFAIAAIVRHCPGLSMNRTALRAPICNDNTLINPW